MTQTEALRLAIRAINSMKNEAETAGAGGDEQMLQEACEIISTKGLEAITAIKAALEAKDEPVAWRALNWGHSPDEYVYRDFDDPVMGIDGKPSPNNEPLYTTPPPRKPLTDEEIMDALKLKSCDGYRAIVRAIEAAHGIKGEA